VYFSGIGWVPFDPTPPAPRAGTTAAASPGALAGASTLALPHRLAAHKHSAGGRAAALTARPPAAGLGAGEALAIGLAALALATGLALGAWRLARASTATALAGDADAAVRELARALPRLGVRLAPATTLAQLERALGRSHAPAASAYVRLLRERRYAPDGDQTRPSARDRRLLRRALCARRGPAARLRALLALPPGYRGR
jgi:hypothetical protein